MPIYEYACGSCEHRFETIQRASGEPLRDCPECGDAALRKLLSAPVFRLKGSGWYETDFKTKDKRNVTDSGAGAGKDDGGQGDGGQDDGGKGGKDGGQGGKDGNGGKTAARETAGAGKTSNGANPKAAASDGSRKSSQPAAQG